MEKQKPNLLNPVMKTEPAFKTFSHQFKKFLNLHFKNHLAKIKPPLPQEFKRALCHTLFAPSSFFRSYLSWLTAKHLKQNPKKIFPWAMAIEMFHTGSLIHDDLPAMDNDQQRRGKPCNHLLFGEDLALLAGSSLFVESFSLLNHAHLKKKQDRLLELFISKVGLQGVLQGQALDLRASPKKLTLSNYLKTIQLKTGSLIEAAVEGPLVLWSKNKKEDQAFKKYAYCLGLAYQMADDLQDKSLLVSFDKTKDLLRQYTEKSLKALSSFKNTEEFEKLSLFNEKRAFKPSS